MSRGNNCSSMLILSGRECTNLEEVCPFLSLCERLAARRDPASHLRAMPFFGGATAFQERLIDVAYHGRSRAPVAFGFGHTPRMTARRTGRFDPGGVRGRSLHASLDRPSLGLPVVFVFVVGKIGEDVWLFFVWWESRYPAHPRGIEDHVAYYPSTRSEGPDWRSNRGAGEVGDQRGASRRANGSVKVAQRLIVSFPSQRLRIPFHLSNNYTRNGQLSCFAADAGNIATHLSQCWSCPSYGSALVSALYDPKVTLESSSS